MIRIEKSCLMRNTVHATPDPISRRIRRTRAYSAYHAEAGAAELEGHLELEVAGRIEHITSISAERPQWPLHAHYTLVSNSDRIK